MNMIEEIKTPISTPMSGTPLPSPMIERSSMVRASHHLKISARFAQQSKAAFVSGNHGPPVPFPGPTFPQCDFTLPAVQAPDVAPLPPRGWACPQTHATSPPAQRQPLCVRNDLDSLACYAAGRVILAGSQRPEPQQAAEC